MCWPQLSSVFSQPSATAMPLSASSILRPSPSFWCSPETQISSMWPTLQRLWILWVVVG